MSPHAVNNFVSDLVAMAQAMERVPQLEQEVRTLRNENDALLDNFQSKCADLEQSRTYAATLEQRVHDLEVARDDAELSFLEADERTSRALDFVKALFGNAGALIQALEPPKAAAPQADSPSKPDDGSMYELVREQPPVAAQLDSHPVGERESPLSMTIPVQEHSSTTSGGEGIGAASTGQREPDPTSAATVDQSMSVASTTEHTAAPTTLIEEPAAQPGPYHGKYYIDVPNFLTLSEWLAGGGTEFDYHYRHHSANRY